MPRLIIQSRLRYARHSVVLVVVLYECFLRFSRGLRLERYICFWTMADLFFYEIITLNVVVSRS